MIDHFSTEGTHGCGRVQNVLTFQKTGDPCLTNTQGTKDKRPV